MKLVRTLGVLSLSSVLLMSGCFLKKKKPQVPQQAQAPTVEPAAPPPAAPPQTEEQPTNTPPTTTAPAPQTATTKAAPKPKRKKPAAKTDTATVAKATTPPATPPHSKIVIKEGGTAETTPQLSARLSRESVSHENQTTQQLIDSAETNLRSINHQLSKGEEDMVAQVRSFIAQSRQATTDGDSVRAHNLALKAHLLSDQLAGQ